MQNTFAELLTAMGGKATSEERTRRDPAPGRDRATRLAPPRMGSKAGESVANQYCQTWDVKNLFLMDGAVLPSNPDKNPTLTILALAWRSTEWLLDEMRSERSNDYFNG